jgi:hypothetical protein
MSEQRKAPPIEEVRNALAQLITQRRLASEAAYARLPRSPVDNRSFLKPDPLVEPGWDAPANWPYRHLSGLLGAGQTLPRGDLNDPLARQAGIGSIATSPIPKPSYEVWMPPGKTVSVPADTVRSLYGRGDVTLRGRAMPREPMFEGGTQ